MVKRNFIDDAESFVNSLREVEIAPQNKRALIEARNAIDLALCRFPVELHNWVELPPDLVLLTFLTQRGGAWLCRRFFQIYIERRVCRIILPAVMPTVMNISSLPLYPESVKIETTPPAFKQSWSALCLLMFLRSRQMLHRLRDITPYYDSANFNRATLFEIRGLPPCINATGSVLFFTHSHVWYGVTRFIWKVTTIRMNEFLALTFRSFPDLRSLRIEITEDPRRLRAFKHFAAHLAAICQKQPTLRIIELPNELGAKLIPYLQPGVKARCMTY